MQQRLLLFGFVALSGLVGGVGGCRKSEPPPVVQSGQRRVEIVVSNQGFSPARIVGRPGEGLALTVRYDKSAGECGRQIVFPSQNIKKTLSDTEPVEIALRLPPEKGEVTFTCGMNMLRGAIVVE